MSVLRAHNLAGVGIADRRHAVAVIDCRLHEVDAAVILDGHIFSPRDSEQILDNVAGELPLIFYIMNRENGFDTAHALAILIKQLEIYRQYRPIYLKLQKVKNKEGFTRKFQRELILYEAAERNLKGKNPPPLETLIKDNKELSERKAKLYEEYKKLKSKAAEIEVIRSNVDTLLNRPKERNPEIEK